MGPAAWKSVRPVSKPLEVAMDGSEARTQRQGNTQVSLFKPCGLFQSPTEPSLSTAYHRLVLPLPTGTAPGSRHCSVFILKAHLKGHWQFGDNSHIFLSTFLPEGPMPLDLRFLPQEFTWPSLRAGQKNNMLNSNTQLTKSKKNPSPLTTTT